MKPEQLIHYDIKLLVALQVLLEEESVSRAAERLSVTQSAMSKMLAKLNTLFGEELFLRTSYGIQPSERAVTLKAPLTEVLENISALTSPKIFKATECTRTFRVSLMDHIAIKVMPTLIKKLSQQAPGVRVQTVPWSRHSLDELAQGQLDLAINLIDVNRANFYQQKMNEIELCVLVRRNHPLCKKSPLLLDDLLAYPFVKVVIPEFNEHHQKDENILTAIGKTRKIQFETNNIICAQQVIAQSDYALIAGRESTPAMLEKAGLTALDLPKELRTQSYSLKITWHQRQHQAAEQKWFRELILQELLKNSAQ